METSEYIKIENLPTNTVFPEYINNYITEDNPVEFRSANISTGLYFKFLFV